MNRTSQDLYVALGEFITAHADSNAPADLLDDLYRKLAAAERDRDDYFERWNGMAHDAAIHRAERDEAEGKLAEVLRIPHFAPENSWAYGNSAEEAGWSYAIRAVRKAAGAPVEGYDCGVREAPIKKPR